MKQSECRFCNCIYFSSGALARKIEKLATESWKKVNLSPSHAYMLLIILEDPGIQPGILAEEMQLQPSTITRLIEKLEEKKLAVRTYEGKITNVYPTPKAKQLLPQMKECVKNFHQSYSSVLGKEESDRLVSNITRLADKL